MKVFRSVDSILISAFLLAVIGASAWVLFSPLPVSGDEKTDRVTFDTNVLRARFENHCFGCHGDGGEEGGFSFEQLAAGDYGDQTIRKWEAVWQNIRAETMPPSDEDRPSVTTRSEWVDWIQSDVFRLDATQIDPGRAVLHISPVLFEKYLSAADKIVGDAIQTSGPSWPETRFWSDHFRMDSPEGPKAHEVKFNDTRQFHFQKKIDRSGKYDVAVKWSLDGAWTNTDQAAEITLWLYPSDDDEPTEIARHLAGFNEKTSGVLSASVAVGDQPMHLSVKFHPTSKDTTSKQLDNPGPAPYSFRVEYINFVGPTDGDVRKYNRGQKILFNGPPPSDADEAALDAMTGEVIGRFATRAFRRPIDDATLARLCQIARETRQIPGNRYEHGIAAAIKLVLASPRFLFRIEKEMPAAQLAAMPSHLPTSALGEPIDDLSLATRISYFLWGGPPDDDLLSVAQDGKLRENLDQQIDRMIDQEWRLRVGVGNFVGQWLKTRDVHSIPVDVRRVLAFRGDDKMFPWQVREAMKQETETMFRYLIEENRPIHELLNADYSFMNESLAKFYGIAGVQGDKIRKVDLPPDSHRRGILTHGSVLLVTSNPTRTSPVKRGLFILENLLGTPAPPAPPNVPSLEESQSGDMKNASLRQVLEQHRRDPACASCHARMDPLGLALEHYNAIGQYREMEWGMPGWRGRDPEPDKPIDPKGVRIFGGRHRADEAVLRLCAQRREHETLATGRRRCRFQVQSFNPIA
ncbi:hypothetical protein Pla100_32310 [Neorhodopirellula pilleata]|uniref:Planctomycete cytochrome C n=2 Tax=Neorhodopirellula pilleata TaxID=2714738 RepID=A0A5C6A880_9BACT|nr:hypothetical protein Pla100_32310 [Neorhodopirellula pilleata]